MIPLTALIVGAMLAFGLVCFALGLWLGREAAFREARNQGKMLYG